MLQDSPFLEHLHIYLFHSFILKIHHAKQQIGTQIRRLVIEIKELVILGPLTPSGSKTLKFKQLLTTTLPNFLYG